MFASLKALLFPAARPIGTPTTGGSKGWAVLGAPTADFSALLDGMTAGTPETGPKPGPQSGPMSGSAPVVAPATVPDDSAPEAVPGALPLGGNPVASLPIPSLLSPPVEPAQLGGHLVEPFTVPDAQPALPTAVTQALPQDEEARPLLAESPEARIATATAQASRPTKVSTTGAAPTSASDLPVQPERACTTTAAQGVQFRPAAAAPTADATEARSSPIAGSPAIATSPSLATSAPSPLTPTASLVTPEPSAAATDIGAQEKASTPVPAASAAPLERVGQLRALQDETDTGETEADEVQGPDKPIEILAENETLVVSPIPAPIAPSAPAPVTQDKKADAASIGAATDSISSNKNIINQNLNGNSTDSGLLPGNGTTPAMALPATSAALPVAASADPEIAASTTVPDTDPQAPTASTAAPPEKPPRFEALSLLQLVRDQMTRRSAPPVETTDSVHASLGADKGAVSAPDGLVAPTPAAAPTPQLAPLHLATPIVDLGGTLGAQVVDMGVSGQWIDGLAREIASLSAKDGQGRFQISSDQLGPVQVDIRQGAFGAEISLTVASEAAETALRQDSDRLRSDATLSAVRISDVRIERAPHVAEPARSADTGGQQSASNGGPSQGAAQNMSQGRSQTRENFAGQHKATADASVLNHGDSRDAGSDDARRSAGRARYA
jgi:flagellar hook-length control protein FliK